MLPLQLLFMTANPVVVMRLRSKSEGKGNPPGVPQDATSFVELQAVRERNKIMLHEHLVRHFFSVHSERSYNYLHKKERVRIIG